MQRRILFAVAALLAACDPNIPQNTTSTVITARFDPSQDPPVVPTPNDLATGPDGLLSIPVPPDATAADKDFYAYLDTLDGYPVNATAQATFDGQLNPDSVTADAVRVYDVTDMLNKVTVAPTYMDTMAGGGAGAVNVPPPMAQWTPGHTYAVAIISGSKGVKGAMGEPVVASATWALLRSAASIVTCTDLTSTACAPATSLIPSSIKNDPAARLKDQTATALQLEGLRLKYKPMVDRVVSDGFQRGDIALLWTFKIVSFPEIAFDPSVALVPTPNDLAIDPATGKIVVPDPGVSPAFSEFISDYLNTLDGFPVSSTATVGIVNGDLDPATVTDQTVVVLPAKPLSGPPDITYDPAGKQIVLTPPSGSWGKENEIIVAVVTGVTTPAAGGTASPLVASPIWALVRSPDPLVDCTLDCTNPKMPGIPHGTDGGPACNVNVTAAPLTLGQAASLECLREVYAPALDALEANAGVSRSDVQILWTFRTSSLPEATFDPLNQVIPFPNDLLRTMPPNPHLQLPLAADAGMLQQQLVQGLNTLDGFSLTAPIVSESSTTLGPIDLGELDPATLDGGTALFQVPGSGPNGPVNVAVCLSCASSPGADGGAQDAPPQLQFVPRTPLPEQSQFATVMTTDLKNTDGKPVVASPTWAILRLSHPVCMAGKSTLPIVSDNQACTLGGLEDTRKALEPLLNGIQSVAGIPRKRVSLAWAFTTEATVSELGQLHDAISSGVTATAIPTTLDSVYPVPVAAVAPAGLPVAGIGGAAGHVFFGTLELPFAETGPGNTFQPPNHWLKQKATFMLTVPCVGASPCQPAVPVNGWPVVLFGHGLTGNHLQMIAIASTLAQAGQATIAIDVLWHGDRTTCAGSKLAFQQAGMMNATDDFACTSPGAMKDMSGSEIPDPVNNHCDEMVGRCRSNAAGAACAFGNPQTGDPACAAVDQGFCLPTANGMPGASTCEGSHFARTASGAPLVNAWNFLNLNNLFNSRDNFRHYALDLAQLVQVLKNPATNVMFNAVGTAVGNPFTVDATQLDYVGQSLGGFNGTLFAAVDPSVKNVALNVPGSDQELVLLTSPAFQPYRDGFLGQLAQTGIVPGTPDFDNLMVLVKTIFDKADPQNFAAGALNKAGVAGGRKVFIQSIEGDTVVPNPTTDELINAASTGTNQPVLYRFTAADQGYSMVAPQNRHGFLLNWAASNAMGQPTLAAQTQVAHFILTGSPQ
jgi:hypothetical protein